MKQLRFALILSALTLCALRAQPDSEPIPDFTNLDEFVYEPKTTLSFGFHMLSGAKTSFHGHGRINVPAGEVPNNATDANILRVYHDGNVRPDNRGTLVNNGDGTTTTTTDSNGISTTVDNGDATFTFVPIDPDGKTNAWSFSNDRQATEAPGFIAMHTYSAESLDTHTSTVNGKGTAGMELAVARDMGKIFKSRFTWSLSVGMTMNDIAAKNTDHVRATLTKVTDLFSLNGAPAPAAPYDSTLPPSTTTPVLDENGVQVVVDGVGQTTTTVDAPVLLANSPASRTTTTTTDETSVSTQSRLRGAYYTFRAGPTVWLPISNRFRISVGAGAALIYAGANYSILQLYQPETGNEITDAVGSDSSRLIPGYYADATLQFDLTPRTGFYAGAIFQYSGDYEQTVNTPTASYSSKVEFGRQHGFHAGMTIKF
jgi:hypothetical protein